MLGDLSRVSAFDQRVFIGYPALIAALGAIGVSIPYAALALNWVASGAAAALTAVLFDDWRLGWAMVLLTPSYLMYSTTVMSEPTLLALTVAGLVIARRESPGMGGVLLGAAGLVRPMACFAVVGQAATMMGAKVRSVVILCVTAAVVVFAGYFALHQWTGTPLFGARVYATDARAYGGHLFGLPFESLIMTPMRQHVASWKIVYIWLHVLVTLVACGLLVTEMRRAVETVDQRNAQLCAAWLVANTVFVLCIGSIWGFHEFHRFILPALPPLLWVFRRWYPRRPLPWAVIGAASFGLALFGVVRNA